MFESLSNARANLKAGATYAVQGPDDWLYYGQVGKDKSIVFFRLRTRELVDSSVIFNHAMMCRFVVSYPSVGRALRGGHWKFLGSYPVHPSLAEIRESIQWPVGTLDVCVWRNEKEVATTRVDDIAIQRSEIMAVWDAVYHVPGRLRVDYEGTGPGNTIGGPIWRERLIKQELARRFPDMPNHELPIDWVWLEGADDLCLPH